MLEICMGGTLAKMNRTGDLENSIRRVLERRKLRGYFTVTVVQKQEYLQLREPGLRVKTVNATSVHIVARGSDTMCFAAYIVPPHGLTPQQLYNVLSLNGKERFVPALEDTAKTVVETPTETAVKEGGETMITETLPDSTGNVPSSTPAPPVTDASATIAADEKKLEQKNDEKVLRGFSGDPVHVALILLSIRKFTEESGGKVRSLGLARRIAADLGYTNVRAFCSIIGALYRRRLVVESDGCITLSDSGVKHIAAAQTEGKVAKVRVGRHPTKPAFKDFVKDREKLRKALLTIKGVCDIHGSETRYRNLSRAIAGPLGYRSKDMRSLGTVLRELTSRGFLVINGNTYKSGGYDCHATVCISPSGLHLLSVAESAQALSCPCAPVEEATAAKPEADPAVEAHSGEWNVLSKCLHMAEEYAKAIEGQSRSVRRIETLSQEIEALESQLASLRTSLEEATKEKSNWAAVANSEVHRQAHELVMSFRHKKL